MELLTTALERYRDMCKHGNWTLWELPIGLNSEFVMYVMGASNYQRYELWETVHDLYSPQD